MKSKLCQNSDHSLWNSPHELHTLIALILDSLSDLLTNSDIWDKQEILQQLSMMQHNGEELQNLLANLVSASKVETQINTSLILLENKKTTIIEHQPSPILLMPSDKKWVENAKRIVRDSLPDSLISIKELAALNNLSVRQFNRKLKKLTHFSAGRFIRVVQLEVARKILEEGLALSVAEVAYRSGFEYPSTFSKLFKKKYGRPPVFFLKKGNVK